MKKKGLDIQALQGISKVFKALSEPIRLKILQDLQNSKKNVSELCAIIGTSQPNLSKHLKILIDADLLHRRQEGNLVFYSAADEMPYRLCEIICKGIEKNLGKQIQSYASARTTPSKKRNFRKQSRGQS